MRYNPTERVSSAVLGAVRPVAERSRQRQFGDLLLLGLVGQVKAEPGGGEVGRVDDLVVPLGVRTAPAVMRAGVVEERLPIPGGGRLSRFLVDCAPVPSQRW